MVGSGSIKKTLTFFALTLLVASSLATGCTSRFGPQTTVVEHYPECYQPIAEMRASEFMVEESTVAGALMGALVGGLIGYAIDGGRGAAIGAGLGAVTGGIVANQYARIAQERDDMLRLQYYSVQLDETVTGMDATTMAAKVARQCYEQQFEVAVADYQRGYIDKEQFHARYVEVSSGLEEASRILGMTIDSVASVSTAYEEALVMESQKLGVEPDVLVAMHNAAMEDARQTTPDQRQQSQTQTPRRTNTPRPNTNLPPDVNEQLTTMVNSGAAVENSVNDAKAEMELINARLDLTNQMATDLLSHSGQLRFSQNGPAIN